MSEIEPGRQHHLQDQSREGGSMHPNHKRHGSPDTALQDRRADFEMQMGSVALAQSLVPVTGKRPEDETDPGLPGFVSVAAGSFGVEAATSQIGRDALAGPNRAVAAFVDIAMAQTGGLPSGLPSGLNGAFRVPLEVPLLGAHSASVTVTATEILIVLHGVPGAVPPDQAMMAEAARSLSLSLFQRFPDRRITLGFEDEAPHAVDGTQEDAVFNPLLKPVR